MLLFHQGQAPREQRLTYSANALALPKEFQNVDITFLKTPKPSDWRTTPPNMADSLEGSHGVWVTYLGYKQQPTTPFASGRVLVACDAIGAEGLCKITVDGLHSFAGDSGAPMLASSGGIIGLLLTDSDAKDVVGIRIDAVRRIGERLSVPWTLYTFADQTQLGAELNSAIRAGDTPKANHLLGKHFNADRSFLNPPDEPVPPVFLASSLGQVEVAMRLIDMGVLDTKRAAAAAASEGRSKIISNLIARRRDLGCALSYAMHGKHENTVALILTSDSARGTYDINALCLDMTPLHWASYRGYENVAIRILDLGADPNKGHIDRVYKRGYPLTNAILRGYSTLVSRLIQAGARADVVEYVTEFRDFIRLPPTDVFGPVHAAAYAGDTALLDQLIQRGGDPDIHVGSQTEGMSPFEVAILSGNVAVAKHLRDRYSVSPLGYRYRGSLLKDLREGSPRLSTEQRLKAEQYIADVREPYCSNLKKSDYKRPNDFYNQQAQCQTK